MEEYIVCWVEVDFDHDNILNETAFDKEEEEDCNYNFDCTKGAFLLFSREDWNEIKKIVRLRIQTKLVLEFLYAKISKVP